MELGIENPSEAKHSPAIGITDDIDIDALLADLDETDETPTETERASDAASLRQQQQSLNEELKSAMIEGDSAAVVRIQNLLRDIPARLVALDVAEIKQGLDNATARLAEVEEEMAYVLDIRNGKNRILAEKILEAEAAQTEVGKENFKLEILKMELTSLHEARREYRLRLERLMDDAVAASGGKRR